MKVFTKWSENVRFSSRSWAQAHVYNLDGIHATRSSVLAALPRHTTLHYAGHGVHENVDTRWGGLVLSDGLLTVQDLLRLRISADLAVLTACQSAAPSHVGIDETLHLASTLHHQGFRHVIASMWPVLDSVVVTLVDEIYSRLISNGTLEPRLVCQALTGGVAAVRNELRGQKPYSWAGYVHIGVTPRKAGSDNAR
jgi:CHAT domain-containing protein